MPNEKILTHDRIWAAIDALANRAGLSPSGLALRAGLDATAFNRSKRFAEGGRPRWPLAATGVSLREFAEMVEAREEH
jgi:phage repressor protein C with HTH and peptisase S24 domain